MPKLNQKTLEKVEKHIALGFNGDYLRDQEIAAYLTDNGFSKTLVKNYTKHHWASYPNYTGPLDESFEEIEKSLKEEGVL